MFQSISDSLRSFWQPKTSETDRFPERKRKRSSNEIDEDDSDVEILAVKKPKKEDGSSGLLSFLTVPMRNMSEWVRKKTVRQDHFFVRPVPVNSHWNRNRRIEQGEQQRLTTAGSSSVDRVAVPNGSNFHTQEADQLSRLPIGSRNGAGENGLNGDVHAIERQPGPFTPSGASSRRSSCSSSRTGASRSNIVQQCFQWKEKEDYLKLLQQHTTVDLGYHASRGRGSHTKGFSSQGRPPQRTSGQCLLPSSSPLPSPALSSATPINVRVVRHQPIPTVKATPSRYVHLSSSLVVPSDRAAASRQLTMPPTTDSFALPHRPGRAQSAHPVNSLSQRTQRQSSLPEAQEEKPVPSVEPDNDVIVIEKETLSSRKSEPASLDFRSSKYLNKDWLAKMDEKYNKDEQERRELIREAEKKKKLLEERREARFGKNLDKRLEQQMRLFDEEPEVIIELPLPEVSQEKPLPELTEDMQREINAALARGHPGQVLSEGFRLQLTRGDIATLGGLNWLNDEVINFYMNMLMDRGEQEGFCKTYAFNTFFYPKLIQGGHGAVKRWTRKIDIFAHPYLVIPVHLGVHWCLCVVFMKEKNICYYDSMGGNNNQCLNAVRQYLADESSQKRSIELDLSEWSTEIVKEIPQQMNGSDCGMFSCMYAESITRGAKITFSQKNMPYFRRRMVYEILKKKLL